MAKLKVDKDTPFGLLLKNHPKGIKKTLRNLDLSCLECKGIDRETIAQIATANGLDVDEFIRVIRSSIEGGE